MSRIGKKPVVIPAGVTVTVENNTVTVKGPKGELTREFSPAMAINVEGNELTVTRPNDEKASRTIHGTTRALIANMVEGVNNGFAKTLDIQGVGYRAQKQGNKIVLNLGYSHPNRVHSGTRHRSRSSYEYATHRSRNQQRTCWSRRCIDPFVPSA